MAPYDGNARVALISVSFNTRELTKLMLLSLAEQAWAPDLRRVVLVDNQSRDGSLELLQRFARDTRIEVLSNAGSTSHGVGLRCAIAHVEQSERALPEQLRSNVFWIVDTDIVFLRSDTLGLCVAALNASDAALLGELQFDVGEPYAHPCCLFVRRDAYVDDHVWPFVDHGAPALWLERSVRCAGKRILDYPVRSDDHIVHRGRGSIAAVNRLGLRHAYATVRDTAHFHGNPRGEALWAEVEARHAARLGEANDAPAADYLSRVFKRPTG